MMFSWKIYNAYTVFLSNMSSQSRIWAIVAFTVLMGTIMFFNYIIWAPSLAFFQLLILSSRLIGHILKKLFHHVLLFFRFLQVMLKLLTSFEKSLIFKNLKIWHFEIENRWEAWEFVVFRHLNLSFGLARVTSSRLAMEGLQCIISIRMPSMEFD